MRIVSLRESMQLFKVKVLRDLKSNEYKNSVLQTLRKERRVVSIDPGLTPRFVAFAFSLKSSYNALVK